MNPSVGVHYARTAHMHTLVSIYSTEASVPQPWDARVGWSCIVRECPCMSNQPMLMFKLRAPVEIDSRK